MSGTVDKIKEKLSILDVIQPYVKLVRAGKYWKGLSPFTKEKTPSFFVSPDRGLYHCFSTGKGGDMFTFIEEMEGVDFRGALKLLAEKAGVELTPLAPGERDIKERVYGALQAAQDFFVASLVEKSDATAYLLGRGLKKENIAEWGIGYAPKEWQALHSKLTELGFNESELERAGLVKKADQESKEHSSSGRVYDRFRGRIMFPISDVSGRIIGFSGRIFPAEGGSASGGEEYQSAKYLNSPETPVFDKSRALYGLDRAREGIRSLGAAILVEGQFDLLLAHQAGYKNAVATSGTAFTEKHAELLKRYTPNLLISYDGDKAGIAAAGRAAAVALRSGLNVKIAKLPPGEDPADLIHKSPAVFKEAIKGALHVVDFYIAHITDAKYDARTFRLEVSRIVLPYIAMIGNKIDQAHFIKRVAEVLQVPEDAVAAEVKKVEKGQSLSASPVSTVETVQSAEPFLSRGETIERLIFGLMLLFKEANDDVLAKSSEEALRTTLSKEEFKTFLDADSKRAALFEADLFLERHKEREVLVAVMEELFEILKRESVHEKYREAVATLRAAELSHDEARTSEVMKDLNALASKLK